MHRMAPLRPVLGRIEAATSDDRAFDFLVEKLGKQRFTNHEMALARDGRPNILGFVRNWSNGIADVVVIFNETTACAWRTTDGYDGDVFAPDTVTWSYAYTPVWTLRAVLSMPPSGHPNEPLQPMPLPAGCKIPETARRNQRIRMRQH